MRLALCKIQMYMYYPTLPVDVLHMSPGWDGYTVVNVHHLCSVINGIRSSL